jgi:hypothetical protein
MGKRFSTYQVGLVATLDDKLELGARLPVNGLLHVNEAGDVVGLRESRGC